MLRNLLFLSIITTLAILALIGFNYYHNATTSTVTEFITTRNIPITPILDTKTVEDLSGRNTVSVNLHDKNIPVVSTTPGQISQTSPVSSSGAKF